MAYKKQSLTEIITRMQGNIEARLPGADARLARSNLNVLSLVFSGALKSLYDFADYISRQIHVTSSDGEYLDAHSTTWGIERKPATYASGNATFIGVDGSVLPAATLVQRADGVEYLTQSEQTVAGGSLNVGLIAVEAGLNANANVTVKVSLVSPISGIENSGVVVSGGIAGGFEEEADESLRARLLSRIQTPPHGGSSADYVTWAKEVEGVTRAWVYPERRGIGTVDVAFVMEDKTDTIMPTAAELQTVQNHLDYVRPVTADVNAISLTGLNLNLDIRIVPDSPEVRAAVELEIKDYLRRKAEPGTTLYISQIREAISLAVGENNHELRSPTADVTHTNLQIPVLGALTWE